MTMGMGALTDPFDVVIQDNSSVPIEHYLYKPLNSVTVLSGFTPGSKTFTLSPGHSFVDPDRSTFTEDFINIQYTSDTFGSRIYQARILSVTENVVTVGFPAGIGTSEENIIKAERVTVDLSLVGSFATPQEFYFEAFADLVVDLQVMTLSIITAGEPDNGKFGDIDPLTNGIYFGQRKYGYWGYLTDIITNAELAASTNGIEYSARTVPLGSYGIISKKEMYTPTGPGVVLRLNGSANDRFSAFVQDDLSDLTQLRIKVFGHLAIESTNYSLNEISVPLTAGNWVKVLEGVQSGTIFVENKEKSQGETTFLATTVGYKSPPPGDDILGVVLKQNVENPFNRRDKVDVYVKSTNINSTAHVRI